ncbi:MAG: NFACT family protein [Peptococcaceae bacterium]|nr:NFACT family protein [Peptococcaceae bacterium]
MPFDGLVLRAVCSELRESIKGGRIERIYQPGDKEILLSVRTRGDVYRLVMSADERLARCHITSEKYENPPTPPAFCTILRKYLEGGRVTSIEQPGFERIITLGVSARDELGNLLELNLVGEFMGKHSNILLVKVGEGIILDGIKRYTHAVSRHREVLPGSKYIVPPRDKKNVLEVNPEEFPQYLLDAPFDSPVSRVLQKRFDGLSGFMAREVVFRAGLSQDLTVEFCGELEMRLIWEKLRGLFHEAVEGQFDPQLLYNADGVPFEYAAFTVSHLSYAKSVKGSMNDVLDAFFSFHRYASRVHIAKKAVLEKVKRERKRIEKRLANCRKDMHDMSKASEYRRKGELLMANLYRVSKGMKQVILDDFYSGERLAVDLDPSLSPSQNAQRYFKKYQKLKTAADRAAAAEEKLSNDLAYLEGVETSLEMAESLTDITEIHEELASEGYLKQVSPNPKKRHQEHPRPLYFQSSDGYDIFVGRNNRQNDYVTFRVAKGEDLWLHARDIPGAHVIIKSSGQVPQRTIEEAASLAAYYSRARNSDKVPVDYTLRKYVRKPRGAKPGFVIYSEEKNLLVKPRRSIGSG